MKRTSDVTTKVQNWRHFEIWQHRTNNIRQHDYYSHNDGDSYYGVLKVNFIYVLLYFFLIKQQVVKLIKLESYMCNGRLTLQDSDFIDYVLSDIRSFVENISKKRVLVFPAFNNFRRYLIHRIVENHFENLRSFSIGEGENRRTVVCFEKDYKSAAALASNVSSPPDGAVASRVVPSQVSTEADSVQENRTRPKRARTMPSVSIYRPPAARKLEQNANLTNIQPGETVGTSSPDKNKFRTAESPKEIAQTGRRNENDGMSVFRNAITSIREQNKVPKCKNGDGGSKKVETEPKPSKPEEGAKPTANQSKQRRPDMQVYVPKGRRSAGFNNNDSKKSVSPVREEKPAKEAEVVVQRNGVQVDCVESKKAKTEDCKSKQPLANTSEGKIVSETAESKVTPEITENESPRQADTQKTGCSENGKKTSCSENGKKTDMSSVKSGRLSGDKVSESKNTKVKATNLNPEEDDWETMYDDTGECLDPSLLDQLTNAVGEVTLERPKSSYNGYKTKSLDTVADEFPHVIEIYNFPPEFQLQDLMMVFSQFKNSGFEIKWVDDTHALGIFSSSAIVSEVLDFYHPFVKTRSLKDGTLLSKMKARRSAEFLLPYKPRPETCSALARRLVTGALGVRLPTSRQEREAEKQILTKARERKRLEAKQKEDAWEGTFS